jgi:hypothetical protein
MHYLNIYIYIYEAPSKARNLTNIYMSVCVWTRLFTGDFATWTAHFVNICLKELKIHQLFIKFINYVW